NALESLSSEAYVTLSTQWVRSAARRLGVETAASAGAPAVAAPPRAPIDMDIAAAYRTAQAKSPRRHWAFLEDVRALLPSYTREQVDAALKRLFVEGAESELRAIDLTVMDDQGSLTDGQRAAAIRLGGRRLDMISIADGSPLLARPTAAAAAPQRDL